MAFLCLIVLCLKPQQAKDQALITVRYSRGGADRMKYADYFFGSFILEMQPI